MNEALQPDQIAAFLRANPDFLAARPELYAVLEPPRRVHGERLADHMAAMIGAARARAASAEAGMETLLETGRAIAGLSSRIDAAVLALLRAERPAECVAVEFPCLLGVDAASLACEALRPGWRTLPAGAVDRLLQNRPVRLRNRPADAAVLHAEAALLAERDVLIRVPGPRPALLALVSRDPALLPAGRGDAQWGFLGEVLGTLLSAR